MCGNDVGALSELNENGLKLQKQPRQTDRGPGTNPCSLLPSGGPEAGMKATRDRATLWVGSVKTKSVGEPTRKMSDAYQNQFA